MINVLSGSLATGSCEVERVVVRTVSVCELSMVTYPRAPVTARSGSLEVEELSWW